MWYVYIPIVGFILVLTIIVIAAISIRRVTIDGKTYNQRYSDALTELDEAIRDVILSVGIIMFDATPSQRGDATLVSIQKNHLVQRIFTKYEVVYFKETRYRWLKKRINLVSEAIAKDQNK